MQDTTISRRSVGPIRRRWRSLGPLRKLGLILVATALAGWGTLRAFKWWTEWPARLVLRVPDWHQPVTFSPDGSILLTRSKEPGEILVWDAASGRKRATWTSPDKRRRFVGGAFSPDGRTFASPWYLGSTGKNFSVDLIDPATGRVRSTFDSPMVGYLGLAFRDGGATVRLVTSDNLQVAVTDAEVTTGRVRSSRTLACPSLNTFREVSGDGRWMAITALPTAPAVPTRVTVWNLDEGREALTLPPITGRIIARALAFSPDRRELAIGLEDGTIRIWDLAARRLRATLRGHGENFSPMLLRYSPDGATLASLGHLSRHVPSIDLARMYLAHYLEDPDHALQTELILLDATTGRLRIWSRSEELVAFSPDGRSVAAGSLDGAVRVHAAPAQAEAR